MLSRRDFIKFGLLGLGALAVKPQISLGKLLIDWPTAENLGRNCTGGWIDLKSKPTSSSQTLGKIYEDTVLVWLREVIGEARSISRRWIETPGGYVYAPYIQPVKYLPNKPINQLPDTSLGKGMWAEVSIPYVDIYPENPPCSVWLQEVTKPRLYYSQVMWIDQIKKNSQDQLIYRVNEPYGNCGDTYWAASDAFRPITADELTPINPDAQDKKIVVDLNYQTLSCYEGGQEVYFCRISSGGKYDYKGNAVDKYATPVGEHLPWRKSIAIHMSGGSTGAGWDTAGIAWTTFFDPQGAAVHATFWHNDFGVPRSHGCVNATPEDSKWVFRWALPHVSYDPGNVNITGNGGTHIHVIAT